MKHSHVKGKTLKMTKVTSRNEDFVKKQKESISRNLQPCYYDLKNTVEFSQSETELTASIKHATFYVFSEKSIPQIKEASESIDTEYDEKINRIKVIAKNFKTSIPIQLGELSSEEVSVKFRKGGDYIVTHTEDNQRVAYGSKLKSSNFNDNGFSTQTYDGTSLRYESR